MSSRIKEDNVIDNKKVILKDELLKILPKTENASIAVGYFFISGLSAIIKPLKDVDKIRLLISNTTDKTTSEALIEGFRSIKEANIDLARRSHINEERKTQVRSDSESNVTKSLEYMSQSSDDRTVVELLLEDSWMFLVGENGRMMMVLNWIGNSQLLILDFGMTLLQLKDESPLKYYGWMTIWRQKG